MNIIKVICLFLGVWFSIINCTKLIRNECLSAYNLILQSVGIVGFIAIQFELI